MSFLVKMNDGEPIKWFDSKEEAEAFAQEFQRGYISRWCEVVEH